MTTMCQMFSITALHPTLSLCSPTFILQLCCTVNGTWEQRNFGTKPELSHKNTGRSDDFCSMVKANGKVHLKPPSAAPGRSPHPQPCMGTESCPTR